MPQDIVAERTRPAIKKPVTQKHPLPTNNAQPPVYRKLWPGEVNRIEAHLLRLDMTDRRLRFCGSLSDEKISDFCANIDWARTTVLGCFVDGDLRGTGFIVLLPEGFSVDAEIAFSVESQFQNNGVGTMLLQKAMAVARNRYIKTAHLLCVRENVKMRRIASKLDAVFSYIGPDIEGTVSPHWPTYLSYIEEAELDGQTLWTATFYTDRSGL